MIKPMIDYLSFGVDTDNYQEKINELVATLQENKELAKLNAANKVADKVTIEIGGVMFEILPNGSNGYAFILNNEDYQLKLAQYRSTKEDYFPISITIHSQCLWSNGPEDAYILIFNWIVNVFGNIIGNKISRADLCCHTDIFTNEDIDEYSFKGIFKACNTRKMHRKVSGIEFGSRTSKIYCRIYNKLLEVNTKRNKLWFFDIWKNSGYINGEVWNIEFELKRDFFKSYNIETVVDLFNSINSIWDYCTKEWLVKIERNRTRTENCSVCPKWLMISNAFDMYVSKPLIKREKQLQADAAALIPAYTGYATTLAARLGISQYDMAMKKINNYCDKYLHNTQKTFEEVVKEKMDLLSIEDRGETECKN